MLDKVESSYSRKTKNKKYFRKSWNCMQNCLTEKEIFLVSNIQCYNSFALSHRKISSARKYIPTQLRNNAEFLFY